MGRCVVRAAKVDAKQADIVKALRQIPGVSVETDHHDILVGYRKRTYWYELKDPAVCKKDGTLPRHELTPSEVRRLEQWKGHYRVVTTLGQILADMGISSGG